MNTVFNPQRVEGTGRLEAFSDGVIAIIVTLLIFEVRVPELDDLSIAGVLAALPAVAPKFVSFAISFFTVAIFWVNHHHFFSRITHSNWKLLWLNNLLLFWLTVVPFTTAFLGDYPTQPVVVALYGLVLCLAGLSFSLMGQYVFFKSDLIPSSVPLSDRQREWRRSLLGVSIYGLAAALAFVSVYVALTLVAVIPLFFVIPNLMRSEG
ncbi:MAG: TMEM175 family protein [Anaerolineales bacterium]